MAVDMGQNDNAAGEGWVRMVHFCLSCPYIETDESWKRAPVVEVARSSSGRTAAELLLAQRQGWVVPMHFDTEPFPPSEFDEEVTDVRAG
jgi:hypothetical protein